MSDADRSRSSSPRFTLAQLLLAVMFYALLLGLAGVVRQTSVRSALIRFQWLLFSPDGQYLAAGLRGLDHDSVQVRDVPHQTLIVNFDIMAADETLVLSPLVGSVRYSGNNELVTVDYPEEGQPFEHSQSSNSGKRRANPTGAGGRAIG